MIGISYLADTYKPLVDRLTDKGADFFNSLYQKTTTTLRYYLHPLTQTGLVAVLGPDVPYSTSPLLDNVLLKEKTKKEKDNKPQTGPQYGGRRQYGPEQGHTPKQEPRDRRPPWNPKSRKRA